jgi:hypothetical protein
MKERWPKSAEENLKRLGDAGIPMDRGVPKCNNVCFSQVARSLFQLTYIQCNELGHMARTCPEEKREVDQTKVSCALCGADG